MAEGLRVRSPTRDHSHVECDPDHPATGPKIFGRTLHRRATASSAWATGRVVAEASAAACLDGTLGRRFELGPERDLVAIRRTQPVGVASLADRAEGAKSAVRWMFRTLAGVRWPAWMQPLPRL